MLHLYAKLRNSNLQIHEQLLKLIKTRLNEEPDLSSDSLLPTFFSAFLRPFLQTFFKDSGSLWFHSLSVDSIIQNNNFCRNFYC